jgi:WhiB family redox-sensing transcriptional regulator
METIDNTVIGTLNRVSAHATAARRANRVNWRLAAACRSADPELFFPLSGSSRALEQIAGAKVVCAGCPVRRQCLEFALRTRPHGIWGGLTELEHRSVKADVRGEDRDGLAL